MPVDALPVDAVPVDEVPVRDVPSAVDRGRPDRRVGNAREARELLRSRGRDRWRTTRDAVAPGFGAAEVDEPIAEAPAPELDPAPAAARVDDGPAPRLRSLHDILREHRNETSADERSIVTHPADPADPAEQAESVAPEASDKADGRAAAEPLEAFEDATPDGHDLPLGAAAVGERGDEPSDVLGDRPLTDGDLVADIAADEIPADEIPANEIAEFDAHEVAADEIDANVVIDDAPDPDEDVLDATFSAVDEATLADATSLDVHARVEELPFAEDRHPEPEPPRWLRREGSSIALGRSRPDDEAPAPRPATQAPGLDAAEDFRAFRRASLRALRAEIPDRYGVEPAPAPAVVEPPATEPTAAGETRDFRSFRRARLQSLRRDGRTEDEAADAPAPLDAEEDQQDYELALAEDGAALAEPTVEPPEPEAFVDDEPTVETVAEPAAAMATAPTPEAEDAPAVPVGEHTVDGPAAPTPAPKRRTGLRFVGRRSAREVAPRESAALDGLPTAYIDHVAGVGHVDHVDHVADSDHVDHLEAVEHRDAHEPDVAELVATADDAPHRVFDVEDLHPVPVTAPVVEQVDETPPDDTEDHHAPVLYDVAQADAWDVKPATARHDAPAEYALPPNDAKRAKRDRHDRHDRHDTHAKHDKHDTPNNDNRGEEHKRDKRDKALKHDKGDQHKRGRDHGAPDSLGTPPPAPAHATPATATRPDRAPAADATDHEGSPRRVLPGSRRALPKFVRNGGGHLDEAAPPQRPKTTAPKIVEIVPLTPAQRIEAECLTLIGPELRRMLMVSFPLTLISIASLWGHAGQAQLLLLLGFAMCATAVLAFVAGFELHLDVPGAIANRRREVVIASAAVSVSWALGVLIVYPSVHDPSFRPLLALGACGALGSMGLATLLCRPAFFALLAPIAATVVVRFGFGSAIDHATAAMAGVLSLGFALHGSAANTIHVTLVRNRVENELLNRKLQRAQELRTLVEGELQRVAETDETIDPVTGVRNRRAFLEAVGDHWQAAEAGYDPFTLAIVDIDQYENLRERYGTDVANELLKQVATIIDNGLRTDDVLARASNSQFALLLNNALSDGAVICLERIRRKVAGTPIDAGEPLMVTISAGIVTWEKGMGIRQLLSRSDMSLARARDNGGNQLSVWGDALRGV